MTMTALEVSGLSVGAMVVNAVYQNRGQRVACRVFLTGVGADLVDLCDAKGGVKYWPNVSEALKDIAEALRVPSGSFQLLVTGGELLVGSPLPTVAKQRAELQAALVANAVNREALQNQIALMADAPNMLSCLDAEKTAVQARLAALPAG